MAAKVQHWHVGDVLEALRNYGASSGFKVISGNTYTVTKVKLVYDEFHYELDGRNTNWALWSSEWKLISKKNISEMSSGEFFKTFANEIKNGT